MFETTQPKVILNLADGTLYLIAKPNMINLGFKWYLTLKCSKC